MWRSLLKKLWEVFEEPPEFLKDFFIKWILPFVTGLGGSSFWKENWIIATIVIAVIVGAIIWALLWYFRKKPTSALLGREKETKRLVNRIRTGQSGVIIGIFGQERTEMLSSLREKNLYGREADNLIFSKIEILGLEPDCTPEQFWKQALEPLREHIFQTNHNQALKRIFSDCQAKDLSQDCLDKLFEEVNQAQLRIVLLLDRFHDILNKPNLNQITFLAKLRSLSASQYPSPLCLVMTAHESLGKLHQRITQELGHSTSPFFNFMDVGEITLGALSESEQDSVLKQLKLPKKARQFIKHEVGLHPYFLRIATHRLKEAYEAQEANPFDVTKQNFNRQCKTLLDDMLSTWTSTMCQVFVQIAQGTFNDTEEHSKALEELEKTGLIKRENEQWQVFSPMFLELLKEQDISKLCTKESHIES
jgi:hypothetical protein